MGKSPEATEDSRQDHPRTAILDGPSPAQIETLKLEQRRWWVSLSICVFLVLAGQSFVSLLQNFYYLHDGRQEGDETRQYRGTWTQALAENVGFPIFIIPLLLLPASNPDRNSPNTRTTTDGNDRSHLFKLALLYVSLGGLLAAHSKLYALGKLYMYEIYALILATQLIFTAFFGFLINKLRFNLWIIASIILTTLAAAGGIGDFGGAADEDEYQYERVAWSTFLGNVAFALSLCIMQLGFQKVMPKTRTSSNRNKLRTILETQICMSLVASIICLIGFLASGEFKELKDDSKRFNEGKTLYALALVGIALAWQVWTVGLVGLVLLVSGLFSNVVSLCSSPFVSIIIVVAFRFMDDEFGWFKRGAIVLALLGLACYVYTIRKSLKKEVAKASDRQTSSADNQV